MYGICVAIKQAPNKKTSTIECWMQKQFENDLILFTVQVLNKICLVGKKTVFNKYRHNKLTTIMATVVIIALINAFRRSTKCIQV